MKENPPIYQKYSEQISKIQLKIFKEMDKLFKELCPLKKGDDPDVEVVADFGITGWDLGPEDRYKVLEFSSGAMYVRNFREFHTRKRISTELWDFYWHIDKWMTLLYYLEGHKIDPGKSPIRTIQRRPIKKEYVVWEDGKKIK